MRAMSSVVVRKLGGELDFADGGNAQTNQYGDLVGQSVIDPLKAVRTARRKWRL
jgi:chaperonin GroEL